jgi:hypothetical protein
VATRTQQKTGELAPASIMMPATSTPLTSADRQRKSPRSPPKCRYAEAESTTVSARFNRDGVKWMLVDTRREQWFFARELVVDRAHRVAWFQHEEIRQGMA